MPAAQLHLSFLGTGRYAAGYPAGRPALLSAMRSGWLLVAGVAGEMTCGLATRTYVLYRYSNTCTRVRSSVCRFIGDILIYMYCTVYIFLLFFYCNILIYP